MFQVKYRQAKQTADRANVLLEQFARVPPEQLRMDGADILRELAMLAHDAANDADQQAIIQATGPFHRSFTIIHSLFAQMSLLGHADLITCSKCPCGDSPVAPERGTIDRPKFPVVPCVITAEAVQAFLTKLLAWLLAGRGELFDAADPLAESIPEIGEKYLIADVGQLVTIAARFCTATRLATSWDRLIAEEGPNWDTVRVGVMRMALLNQALDLLRSFACLADDDEESTGGLPALGELFGTMAARAPFG